MIISLLCIKSSWGTVKKKKTFKLSKQESTTCLCQVLQLTSKRSFNLCEIQRHDTYKPMGKKKNKKTVFICSCTHFLSSWLSAALVPCFCESIPSNAIIFLQHHFAGMRMSGERATALQRSWYLFKDIFHIYVDKLVVYFHYSCYHTHKAIKYPNFSNI